jgi:hypothetical protein
MLRVLLLVVQSAYLHPPAQTFISYKEAIVICTLDQAHTRRALQPATTLGIRWIALYAPHLVEHGKDWLIGKKESLARLSTY